MQSHHYAGLIFCALAGIAGAQQGQVAGPVAGYVFDAGSLAVRPVLGIPGASVFGSAVPFGYDIASATISPGADSAVLIAADGSLHFVRLNAGTATEIPFNGSSAKPDRIVFSPSGTAVALIAAGHAQVFTGLPAAVSLAGSFDFGTSGAASSQAQAQITGRPAAMVRSSLALSDDGAWMLTVANGSLELIGSGSMQNIGTAGRGAFIAFAPSSHDAAIADPLAQTVTLLRNVIGAPVQQQVLEQNASLAGITGVAFAADGKSLFVAGGAAQGVTAFDLTTGAHTAASCNCSATGLYRMGTVYRLNEAGSGPLWLLDTAAPAARIVFVPALQ